jgi:DNA-binding CsgD family transcriptional regulator
VSETAVTMSEARRASVLAAYERHARRFEQDALSHSRRRGAPLAQRVVPMVRASNDLRPSGRQLEILGLIAEGHSNRSVAVTLGISEETVKSHVKQLAERLGSRSRAHTVSLGYRYGLLVAEPRLYFPGDTHAGGADPDVMGLAS